MAQFVWLIVFCLLHVAVVASLGLLVDRCVPIRRPRSRGGAVVRSSVCFALSGCIVATGCMGLCSYWWFPFGAWSVLPTLMVAGLFHTPGSESFAWDDRILNLRLMAAWVFSVTALEGLVTGLIFGLFRSLGPRPPGLCSRCGYDLTGNTSGICPECGTMIPKPSISRRDRMRQYLFPLDRDEFPRRRRGGRP